MIDRNFLFRSPLRKAFSSQFFVEFFTRFDRNFLFQHSIAERVSAVDNFFWFQRFFVERVSTVDIDFFFQVPMMFRESLVKGITNWQILLKEFENFFRWAKIFCYQVS